MRRRRGLIRRRIRRRRRPGRRNLRPGRRRQDIDRSRRRGRLRSRRTLRRRRRLRRGLRSVRRSGRRRLTSCRNGPAACGRRPLISRGRRSGGLRPGRGLRGRGRGFWNLRRGRPGLRGEHGLPGLHSGISGESRTQGSGRPARMIQVREILGNLRPRAGGESEDRLRRRRVRAGDMMRRHACGRSVGRRRGPGHMRRRG